ncbi:MAG: sugar-transfer associated ATP-grasp domain-containing protein [Deltaproteobacteria bacterium]|jgi:Sugar-transfer associated ATP-grasp
MKFWHALKHHLLNRVMPHGLVSPCYLLPGQSRHIRIHRSLWLCSFPRVPLPIFLLVEGFLYLRWILFSAWVGAFRAVRRLGPAIRDREGIAIRTQFNRILKLALLHAVPPFEAYAFRLYRGGWNASVWNYVFTHEIPAFHRWRDARQGKTGLSVRVLGDKQQTAEILSRHGLPVAPVLEMVNTGGIFDPSRLTEYTRLFVKPCYGSAGRDCFVLERDKDDSDFKVFEAHAGMVASRSTWQCLLDNLAREPYLVQPLMANHPVLAGLCETKDAVTVRIITEAPIGAPVRCYAAMLEIPGPLHDPATGKELAGKKRFHVILPINPTSGNTLPWNADIFPLSAEEAYKKLYARAENMPVPCWDQIRKTAAAAHALFPDVYAIAWDYVITHDGPFLLEGNTGWGTRMPQMIHGGLLIWEA